MDKDRPIAKLEAENARLRDRLAALETKLAAALDEIARLKRNSRTSSKPPSSDSVKPLPPPPRTQGRPLFAHRVQAITRHTAGQCLPRLA